MNQTVRAAVLALAHRYNFEEGHSLQDERLALRLFDEMARLGLHTLGAPQFPQVPLVPSIPAVPEPESYALTPRKILSLAALLHDIGYVEGYENHHKTAFRLIMAAPIPGLSPHDQALIAHIARYHRGALPNPSKHEAFAALSPADQQLVTRLGAILRFADGLDRSHTDAVQDLRCELEGKTLVVTLLPGTNDEAERWAGQKKARWFEDVFGVKVVLR